ncbi:MAG: DNA repair protein RecO [Thermodesulfovibrio sp.]|nr:DNA repair protein RecO [Thermodesulfovibrio sp.]MDW7999342.1 DNA repair protein RecO [Thermodesulfovibrio sp.]
MVYSTEGIVLKSTSYGEADLIVTYFTKDYGLINLFAKSPRKIKSRFGSSLEPLTYSRISFVGKEEKLQKIIQSDIIESFQQIRENYKIFLKLSEVLKILIEISPKKEPNVELFKLFLNTLFQIQKKQNPDNYLVFIKVKTLKIMGYFPDFTYCGICRNKLKEEFYYSQGFIVCRQCISDNSYLNKKPLFFPVSRGVVKLFNKMSTWSLVFLERVKITDNLLGEMENFLKNHIMNTIKA